MAPSFSLATILPPEPKDSDFSKVRKESRWTVSYPWFVSFIVKTTTVSAWWYPVGFPPGKGGYNLSRVQQEREGGGGGVGGEGGPGRGRGGGRGGGGGGGGGRLGSKANLAPPCLPPPLPSHVLLSPTHYLLA